MNNRATQLTWFEVETIPRVNYFLMVPVFKEYGAFISKRGGSDYFRDVLWVHKNGTSLLCYPRINFDKGTKFLADKAVADPAWAEKLNREMAGYINKFFSAAQKLEKEDLSKLSNRKLALIAKQYIYLHQLAHVSGQMTTWLIDADQELFSKRLREILVKKIDESGRGLSLAKTFSILTTPEKPSSAELEVRDSLKIVGLLEKDKKAKDLFLNKNISSIKKNLDKINPVLKKAIGRHYKKYFRQHYVYEGPILELDYFIEIWKGILKQGNLSELAKESRDKFVQLKKEREDIFKVLKLNSKEKRLFGLAKDIVYLKAWRKDCQFFGCYVFDKIMQEIGRRLGLTLKHARYFCDWEIEDALIKNKYDATELNERHRFSIVYSDSTGRPQIYAGKKAEEFFKKLNFEKKEIKQIGEFRGTCASPGFGRGAVKIVETVEDIKKMKKGDILISETTYPALVPAMKLAAAIVTNAGGLTCHAAIVSRELKIPCVVGTKIANKVLKDGDMVEVDAERGIVKIIK